MAHSDQRPGEDDPRDHANPAECADADRVRSPRAHSQPDGVKHPLFSQVLALIDKGKTWVKLSGAYADTKVGPPTYADATTVAQAYAKRAPERCVWGSDWPHPGVRDPEPKPDDTVLFDLLLAWAPDENVRHRIVVENPAVLYDFPKNA